MPDVVLDGENVSLPGALPASFSEVRATLEENLAARGRVLSGLSFDGQLFDESLEATPVLPGVRIEATSLALADALAQIGAALVPEFEALKTAATDLAGEVLRVPWSEIQPCCIELVETATGALQRAIEVAALSGENSPAASTIAGLARALEAAMQAVQRGDAAELALQLDGGVGPALVAAGEVLAGKIGP